MVQIAQLCLVAGVTGRLELYRWARGTPWPVRGHLAVARGP
jgi:hypothetical protein